MDEFELMCIEIDNEMEQAEAAGLAPADVVNYYPIVIDDFQIDMERSTRNIC